MNLVVVISMRYVILYLRISSSVAEIENRVYGKKDWIKKGKKQIGSGTSILSVDSLPNEFTIQLINLPTMNTFFGLRINILSRILNVSKNDSADGVLRYNADMVF